MRRDVIREAQSVNATSSDFQEELNKSLIETDSIKTLEPNLIPKLKAK